MFFSFRSWKQLGSDGVTLHLVDEINKSGRGSDRLWKSVTIPEFKKFIASLQKNF
jgi:hypothetical protein